MTTSFEPADLSTVLQLAAATLEESGYPIIGQTSDEVVYFFMPGVVKEQQLSCSVCEMGDNMITFSVVLYSGYMHPALDDELRLLFNELHRLVPGVTFIHLMVDEEEGIDYDQVLLRTSYLAADVGSVAVQTEHILRYLRELAPLCMPAIYHLVTQKPIYRPLENGEWSLRVRHTAESCLALVRPGYYGRA